MPHKRATVGTDTPLMRNTEPVSIFKTERKRAPKSKLRVEEPQAGAVVEPEVEPEPEVKMRRCPGHSLLFGGEADQRAITEFRFSKTTGKLQGICCARCSNKRHLMYVKLQRQEKQGRPFDSNSMRRFSRSRICGHNFKMREAQVTALEAARQTA